MGAFLQALADPDLAFLRYALLAGLLASPAFGIVGAYVVTRRITYIAGAIAHCVLGGIGAALYAQHAWGLGWCTPMAGAVAAALFSAVVIGLVSLSVREREDAVIGALWVGGMAAGLLFLHYTPGYIDPMTYLFGNILLIAKHDLYFVAALDAAVIGLGLACYHKFVAVCFDEEFARLRGLNVRAYYLLLLTLTALTVVLLIRLVGIVLVIALITLPPTIAGFFAKRVWHMMLGAALLCMGFTAAGLALSYALDAPTGPVIVFLAAAVYLLAAAGRIGWERLRR